MNDATPIPLPDPVKIQNRLSELGREQRLLRRLLRLVVSTQAEPARPRQIVRHPQPQERGPNHVG